MYYWSLKTSKLKKHLNFCFHFLIATLMVDYLCQGHIYLLSIFLGFYFYLFLVREDECLALENCFGKWVIHLPNKSYECKHLALFLETKYLIVLVAKSFSSSKNRVFFIFHDQFNYADEAYFRYFFNYFNKKLERWLNLFYAETSIQPEKIMHHIFIQNIISCHKLQIYDWC